MRLSSYGVRIFIWRKLQKPRGLQGFRVRVKVLFCGGGGAGCAVAPITTGGGGVVRAFFKGLGFRVRV